MLRKNRHSFESPRPQWDCITDTHYFIKHIRDKRQILEENVARRDWTFILQSMEYEELTNTTRLNGQRCQSPLHVAAETGAPLGIVQEMLLLGAWRLLRDANGKRPLDLAQDNGHKHLCNVLVPIYEWDIRMKDLLKIQQNFHRLITKMEEKLVINFQLRLPLLEPMLEFRAEFPELSVQFLLVIPGSHGWISYWLAVDNGTPYLSVESYCHLVSGSGMLHHVTTEGVTLVKSNYD